MNFNYLLIITYILSVTWINDFHKIKYEQFKLSNFSLQISEDHRRTADFPRQTLQKIASRTTMVQDYQQSKIIDNRKAKDKNLIDQEYERILNYLQDTNMEDAPSKLKLQNGLSLKDYTVVVNHLLQIIGLDPIKLDYEKAEFTKKVGEGLINIQETLGYPEKNRLKQTDMSSISSTNSPKALLFLTWLVELTEFSTIMTGDIGQLDEDFTQEQFISEIYTNPEPEKILEGIKYNSILHTLYKDFLRTNGENVDNSNETMFGIMDDELKQNFMTLESKQKQAIFQINKQKSRYSTMIEKFTNQYTQYIQQYKDYLDESQLQTFIQTQSQLIVDQDINSKDVLEFFEMYKQKFENILNMLNNQYYQNEQSVLPDLREIIRINENKIQMIQGQQEQIDKEFKKIEEQSKQQSGTYQDYVKAELQNKNLNDENNKLELQINETNGKIEQQQQFMRTNEEQISQLIDRLNILQIEISDKEGVKDIAKLQSQVRQQIDDIDAQQKSLNINLNKLGMQYQDLDHVFADIMSQVDQQDNSISLLQKQIDQENAEIKKQNDHYQQSIPSVQNDMIKNKQLVQQLQNQIEEVKKQNIALTSEFNQQQKRIEGEQKKLVEVVTQLYQLIAESRKLCRNSLEMLRDDLCKAKEQLQNWKQESQI